MTAHSRPAGDRGVSLALCDTGAVPPTGVMREVLSAAEAERLVRCRTAVARRQFLASRWLMRTHAGAVLGLEPAEVPVTFPPGAAPRLAGHAWCLGLSHGGELVLCAMAREARVGCDVERHRPRPRMQHLADRHFSAGEARQLRERSADEAAALRDFYRLWTLKEAGKKALDLGLASGLDTPAFRVRPALACTAGPGPGGWRFSSAEMALGRERYSIALAVNATGAHVQATRYRWAGHGLRPDNLALDWQTADWPDR